MRARTFLFIVALGAVGCGPKPAPKVDWTKPITGYQVFEFTSDPPGPAIDPNPYRFIGGQRYGEGWASAPRRGQLIPMGCRFAVDSETGQIYDWTRSGYVPEISTGNIPQALPECRPSKGDEDVDNQRSQPN